MLIVQKSFKMSKISWISAWGKSYAQLRNFGLPDCKHLLCYAKLRTVIWNPRCSMGMELAIGIAMDIILAAMFVDLKLVFSAARIVSSIIKCGYFIAEIASSFS